MAQSLQSDEVKLTSQQLSQLLKLLPSSYPTSPETDDELDCSFSDMVTSCMTAHLSAGWIIDSGASDHMTASLESLVNVKPAAPNLTIKLLTGAATVITHIGDLILQNGLKLSNVLYVPQFQHSLISIHRLSQDNKCEVIFHPSSCSVVDVNTRQLKALGKLRNGLYYLDNSSIKTSSVPSQCLKAVVHNSDQFTLWHHR